MDTQSGRTALSFSVCERAGCSTSRLSVLGPHNASMSISRHALYRSDEQSTTLPSFTVTGSRNVGLGPTTPQTNDHQTCKAVHRQGCLSPKGIRTSVITTHKWFCWPFQKLGNDVDVRSEAGCSASSTRVWTGGVRDAAHPSFPRLSTEQH